MTGSADRAKMFWYIDNPTTAAMALRAVCSGIQHIIHTQGSGPGIGCEGTMSSLAFLRPRSGTSLWPVETTAREAFERSGSESLRDEKQMLRTARTADTRLRYTETSCGNFSAPSPSLAVSGVSSRVRSIDTGAPGLDRSPGVGGAEGRRAEAVEWDPGPLIAEEAGRRSTSDDARNTWVEDSGHSGVRLFVSCGEGGRGGENQNAPSSLHSSTSRPSTCSQRLLIGYERKGDRGTKKKKKGRECVDCLIACLID